MTIARARGDENTSTNLRANLRIIWTVAAKDIVDAIRNKTTLGTLATVLFLIVFYRTLPLWEGGNEVPRIAIHDAGNSSLVAKLGDSAQFDLIETSSQGRLEAYVGDKDMVVLGLAIPSDFDQRLASGLGADSTEQLELDGYVVHWASQSAVAEVQTFFEGQLSEMAGHPVHINISGNTIYTQKDSRGYALVASLSVVVAITMLGVSMTPNLMLEERQAKTMDALLVSPASVGQVVIGKALTGLFYCLTVAAVVLAFNTALVTHWGLAILAVVSGSLFAVALGLLLGSTLKNGQQLKLWGFILYQPLLIPIFLSIMDDILPSWLITTINWIPTVAMSEVLRVSFSDRAPLAQFGPELGLVAGSAVILLASVAWIVRRSDR